MPRPGQNAYRKRQLEEAQEEGSKDINADRSWGPVLPIADLPDDWEGEAEDGATYLALVSAERTVERGLTARRASAALPQYTAVRNPYRQLTPPPPVVPYPDLRNGGYSPSAAAEPGAGPSRHPALPRESWETVFPTHFQSYRRVIAAHWPPSPPLPYPSDYAPLPYLLSSPDWMHWLKGTPLTGSRKKKVKEERWKRKTAIRQARAAAEAEAEAEELMEDQAEVEAEVLDSTTSSGGLEENGQEDGGEEMDIEVDDDGEVDPEEEAVNEQTLSIDEEEDDEEEEDDPVFDPPEPLISVIQKFTTYQIIAILKHTTQSLEVALQPLERTVLPSQPDSPSDTQTADEPVPNPLSSHTARWIFALLAILEEHLMGDQVSILRELARAVMRVGAWRWVRAVVQGEIAPRTPANGDGEDGGRGTNWELGQRWKAARAEVSSGELAPDGEAEGSPDERTNRRFPGHDETGVDETIARCWMIIHCISAGWAQRDLLVDLDTLFK